MTVSQLVRLPARGGPLQRGGAAAGAEAVRYCAVAALNFTTSPAGTRPRFLTSMPWDLAHSRTATGSAASAARRPPRPGPAPGAQH